MPYNFNLATLWCKLFVVKLNTICVEKPVLLSISTPLKESVADSRTLIYDFNNGIIMFSKCSFRLYKFV